MPVIGRKYGRINPWEWLLHRPVADALLAGFLQITRDTGLSRPRLIGTENRPLKSAPRQLVPYRQKNHEQAEAIAVLRLLFARCCFRLSCSRCGQVGIGISVELWSTRASHLAD